MYKIIYDSRTFRWDLQKKLTMLQDATTQSVIHLAREIKEDTEEFVPILTGALRKSAKINSKYNIVYRTQYARRQYYEHKTRKYWVERAKRKYIAKWKLSTTKFLVGRLLN